MDFRKFIPELLERKWLALVCLGVLLVVFTAEGQVVFPSLSAPLKNSFWQNMLGIAGYILLVFGLVLLALEELPKSERGVRRYGIKITSLRPLEAVNDFVTIRGTFAVKPPRDKKVRLFTLYPQPSADHKKQAYSFQPQRRADGSDLLFDEKTGTWSKKAYIGTGCAGVMVVVMGEAGRILWDFQTSFDDEIRTKHKLTELPDDIQICDQIEVKKAQPVAPKATSPQTKKE